MIEKNGIRGRNMQQEVLYIKLNKDVEVTQDKIYLKDLGTLYCKNDNIVNGCNGLKICELQEAEPRKVISVMKIIEIITLKYPGIRIENIGEADILIERVKHEKKRKISQGA